MHRIQIQLSDCVKMGVQMATALAAIAATSVVVGTIAYVVQHGASPVMRELPKLPVAAAAVVGSYYVAGVLGGVAYYYLQSLSHVYVGQVLLAFVIGGIAYGAVGLSAALAYSLFGLNMLGFPSTAEAWRLLPIITLVAAGMTAIVGPPIWRSKNR